MAEAVAYGFGGILGGLLTQADKIAILVAFCGVSCEETKYDRKTFCLGFVDRRTGRHIYQTVPVVSFHYTPFCLEIIDNRRGVLHCDPRVTRMYLDGPISVSFGGTFLRPTNHHFNQFDRNLELLPVSLIANPRSFCSENCVGCSRTALGLHKEQRGDYIERHVAEVDADFASTFPRLDKSELKYVSVSTGCECNRAEEVQMFLRLVDAYREHGFSPEFVIFSNKIRRQRDMEPLHARGIVGYVATVEVINDRLRERLLATVPYVQGSHLRKVLGRRNGLFMANKKERTASHESCDMELRVLSTNLSRLIFSAGG